MSSDDSFIIPPPPPGTPVVKASIPDKSPVSSEPAIAASSDSATHRLPPRASGLPATPPPSFSSPAAPPASAPPPPPASLSSPSAPPAPPAPPASPLPQGTPPAPPPVNAPAPPAPPGTVSGASSGDPASDIDETVLSPATRAARRWSLVFPEGERHVISAAAVLGRNPTVQDEWPEATVIRILDPAKSVSKTHAVVVVRDGALLVGDLHSTNGVAVVHRDDETVVEGAGLVPLPSGATLVLGEFEIVVENS